MIEIVLNPSVCDHVLRTVYELPCVHELLRYSRENRPISLEAIDQHWEKLNILPNSETRKNLNKSTKMILFKKFFERCMKDEKKVFFKKIKGPCDLNNYMA